MEVTSTPVPSVDAPPAANNGDAADLSHLLSTEALDAASPEAEPQGRR